MYWHNVRRLEFGTVNHHLGFFRTLKDRLPNLRSFKLGPHHGTVVRDFFSCFNHFLMMVGSLEEFLVECYDAEGTPQLPMIAKHGAALITLKHHSQERLSMRLRRDLQRTCK